MLALCFRVEIARQVLDASECGLIGVEVMRKKLIAVLPVADQPADIDSCLASYIRCLQSGKHILQGSK